MIKLRMVMFKSSIFKLDVHKVITVISRPEIFGAQYGDGRLHEVLSCIIIILLSSILYPDNGVCLCVTDVGGSSGKVCPVGLQVQCRSEC